MNNLISSITAEPTQRILPDYDAEASVDMYSHLVRGTCFDHQMNCRSLARSVMENGDTGLKGKSFFVNTVRHGEDLAETPIGNLWWVAVAKLHQLHGAQIHIVDFYNQPTDSRADIEQLCELFDFDPNTTSLYRAEDFSFDEDLFGHICNFVEQNREAIVGLHIFPQIKAGFQAIIDGDFVLARKHLSRLVEELKVFLLEHDNENGTLLLNHEVETPSLLKTLYPSVNKQIAQVSLPKTFNEFRGGKCSISQISNRFLAGARNQDKDYYDMVVETLALIERCEEIDFARKGGLSHHPISVNTVVAPKTDSHRRSFYNTSDVMDLLAHDGVDPNPDAICDLILSNWNNSKVYQKQHLSGPFSTLIAKKRKEPQLLVRTFLRFIQRTITSEGFTHHCVFNPLFEHVVKIANEGYPECDVEITQIRELLLGNLEAIKRITLKAATLRNKPQTVQFEDLRLKLTSFLGSDISFSASSIFHDAISARDLSFFDQLRTFLFALREGKKILSEEELSAVKSVLDAQSSEVFVLIDEVMGVEDSSWIKKMFDDYLHDRFVKKLSNDGY